MEKPKKIWDSQLLPQIENTFDGLKDNIIPADNLASNEQATKAMIMADKSFKRGHNEFTYALWWILCIVGCLLIIPAYWLIKKLNSLKKHKQDLLDNIKQCESNVLQQHRQIIRKIDLFNLIKPFEPIAKYQHKGAIPQELIDDIKSISLMDTNNDKNKNSYKTSWGLYDDKILIHAQEQRLEQYQASYVGSISVSNGNSSGTQVVTATIVRPAYKIVYENQTYAYIKACDRLSFHLEGMKSKLLDFNYNKKHNYNAMENTIFETKIKWYRNDSVQFRMIFTPWAQETYVTETDGCTHITPEWSWAKESCFIYNEYKTDAHTKGIISYLMHSINKFADEPRYNVEQFINDIKLDIINYYQDIYKSMTYMWATSVMQSEHHDIIIDKALKHYSINKNNIIMIAHYILSRYHNYAIAGATMDTFAKYNTHTTRKVMGCDVYDVDFNTTSFNVVDRTTTSLVSSVAGMVSVPIKYKEFIPLHGNKSITLIHIPSSLRFYNCDDLLINNTSNKRLLELLTINNMQYANGFLSFDSNNSVSDATLSEIIQLIKQMNN